MYEKLTGVVLSTVKYSDRHNIVHIFTDGCGRMAFAVPAGGSRGARQRNALLMPLSLVELEARVLPGHELATVRDLRPIVLLTHTRCNPAKSAVAMFMSEVLTHCIQEQERNTALFSFLLQSVTTLESLGRGVANFHICFLYGLGAHLGIQPDIGTYRPGYWFDMDGGTFMPHPGGSLHMMRPEEAAVIKLLSRMTYDNLHAFRFNREQRNQVLDTILAYYRLHNSTLGTLRSPEVLKQLFV